MTNVEEVLGQQVAYYRARAPEYDDWFLRRGRYDRGEAANACWFREVAEVQAALAQELPVEDVLELACGTGQWTQRLARAAHRVVAIDASTEAIERNRARLEASSGAGDPPCAVAFETADVFTWSPDRQYDLVFFGFWLSHVPPARFDAFWEQVRRALAPRGRLFFVDNRASSSSSRTVPAEGLETRTLADGRAFDIVKVFYEPAALQRRLAALGFEVHVKETERHFVYGAGQLA